MKSRKIDKKSFITQDLALDSYMATLLTDIPADTLLNHQKDEVKAISGVSIVEKQKQESSLQRVVNKRVIRSTKAVVKPINKASLRNERRINAEEILAKKVPIPVAKAKPDLLITPSIVEKKAFKISPSVTDTLIESVDEAESTRLPECIQDDFLALFFKVGDSVLATPLVNILRTVKFEDNLTRIPNQPDWYLGIKTETDNSKVSVLNTLKLISHELKSKGRDVDDIESLNNILLTLDGQWGLACDEIMTIAKVFVDKVRWRTHGDKNPWFLGTVVDGLAIVVDIDAFVPNNMKHSYHQ